MIHIMSLLEIMVTSTKARSNKYILIAPSPRNTPSTSYSYRIERYSYRIAEVEALRQRTVMLLVERLQVFT